MGWRLEKTSQYFVWFVHFDKYHLLYVVIYVNSQLKKKTRMFQQNQQTSLIN